ncbi:MAG: DUF72 domain-containing protein [Chloroflexi bacterium]|nr:DUF72 domain-containing protein [Chloroflexota bacterium]
MAFEDYVREYRLVEVQQTFYEPPQDGTMRRWRALAPSDFEFTIKAWQLVTHDASSPTYRRLRSPLPPPDRAEAGGFRTSPVVLRAWDRTLDCAAILRATAILLQCPASFRPTDDNIDRLRTFFRTVARPPGVRMLWEPRGPWPAEVVATLCRDLDLVHVVDPFISTTVTPEQTYLRLHGINGARHVYTDDELDRLAGMLPIAPHQPPYVLFNNIPRVDDARRFREVLERRRSRMDGRPQVRGSS